MPFPVAGGNIAKLAYDKAENADNKVDTFQKQIDKIVVEGATDPLTRQALVDAEGTEYNTLKERLDKKETETATLLAQTTQEVTDLETNKADKVEARLKSENITMLDLSQDVKEAMTGGSVAVVGKNMIDRINIKSKAIKEENVLFIERATENIFNPDTVTYGFYVSPDHGGLIANSGFNTTDFISVEPNTDYRVDGESTLAFYDENYNFISGKISSTISITTPANVRFLRKSFSSSISVSSFRVYRQPVDEIGQRPFVPYKIKIPQLLQEANLLKAKPVGKNYFDKTGADADKIVNASGSILDGASWSTTDYLVLDPSVEYTATNCRFILEYDKHLIPIIGTFKNINSQYHTFVTHANTAYMRVTYDQSKENLVQVEKGNVATELEEIKYGLFFGDKEIDIGGDVMKQVEVDLIKTTGYKKEVDTSNFQVYLNNDSNDKVVAIFRDIAVKVNKTNQSILLSTTGINGAYGKAVLLTSAYFPGLIPNSYIQNVFLMPWSRNSGGILTGTNWRMIVITDRGQIYHNFPKRGVNDDGLALSGDEMRFEESVVWDLEERKFPTKSKTHSNKEYYFPCLPDAVYEHHPKLNSETEYVNTYGNGGFGLTKSIGGKTYARFYRNGFDAIRNSFITFGGFDFSDNLALIGTYRNNQQNGEGVRTGVFVTDDGGREWYLKYEFSDSVGSVGNWGNAIDFSSIAGAYTNGSLSVQRKTNVIPTNAIKEPTDKFILGNKITVSNITKANPSVVTTSVPHNLITGSTIAFYKNNENSPDFNFMTNNALSTTNHGNGIFFKVKVLSATTFELYEYVHSWSNNIPCQHIHGINRVKDGFALCTGETYPMGWVFYIPTHKADNYERINAYDEMEFIRLNSSDVGIQRAIGILLPDDGSGDIIVASDTAVSPRGEMKLADGRTETFSRNTAGVFRGKISDIDDFSKFTCILECDEPSYYFKEHNGVFYHFGQRGELAISFDKGKTWVIKQFSGSNFYDPVGATNVFVGIGDAIIGLK